MKMDRNCQAENDADKPRKLENNEDKLLKNLKYKEKSLIIEI